MNGDTNHIHDFIRHLLSATTNASLYGMKHPQVMHLSSQAFASIGTLLQSRPDVTILVVENELVIDGRPQDLSLFLNRFTQILKSRGIGSLKLLSGVTKEEVDTLIGGLAKQLDDGAPGTASSDHIRLGKVDLCISEQFGNIGANPGIPLSDMPREELTRFMEIYKIAKSKHTLQINGVFDVVSSMISIFRKEGKPLLSMAALRDKNEYTFTHSTSVCVLNLAQAMALGIKGQLLNDIGVAAMLHDVGKLFIPEEILTKKEKLAPDEYNIIMRHPVLGAHHLLETSGVPRLAVIVAYEHHLKFDLSGYPKVSPDWRQNLCSHMTAISDLFDALRTGRSYREPVPLNEIAGIMQAMMGTALHPALTRNFLRIISKMIETDSDF